MTWGNRNPQPKEKKMNLLDKIDAMLKGEIAIAKNEGFTRGANWQRNLKEDDAIAKARNEGFAEGVKWEQNLTSSYSLATAHNEGFDEGVKRQREKDFPTATKTKDRCEDACCEATDDPNIEKYDNHGHDVPLNNADAAAFDTGDGRYEEYNDGVWPGEDE